MSQQHKGNYLLTIVLAGLVLAINGCSEDKEIPDVNHINAAFDLVTFDRAMFDMDSTVSDEKLMRLRNEFPVFWKLYFTHILPVRGMESDSGYQEQFDEIRKILADVRLRAIADSVFTHYSELGSVEADLYRGFQYYKYYFPDRPVPTVYTLISDFGYFPFIFPDSDSTDAVGISLEMFLGANFPYTEFAGNHPMFSQYLLRTYNREHLVKKAMDVLIDDLVGPPPGDRLLDQMIHNGKKLYLLDFMLPELPDTVIFEFSPQQLEWCRDNERNLWAHYLSEDLLYSNEFRKINKLVNYSPNVPGMPAEAPGRVANWTGYRIFEEVHRQQPDLSLRELAALRDAQAVLEMARYKPR